MQPARATEDVGEQAALQRLQHPVDDEGDHGNEQQHQEDILARATPHGHVDDVAQSPRFIPEADGLGQHDVAEGETEQQPKRVADSRQRERDQHLEDDLPAPGPEGVGGVDILFAHLPDGLGGVGENEGDAGQEDEHHLLKLPNAEG